MNKKDKKARFGTSAAKSPSAASGLRNQLRATSSLSTSDGSIELMDITPEFAAELLCRLHPNQRMLRQRYVDVLASAMKLGRFRWVADPIRLDTDLFVIDGQHRLSAVVKSGVTLKNAVIVTVHAHDAILSIDQNRPRTVMDMHATRGGSGISRTISGAIVAESTNWNGWRGMAREDQILAIERCEFIHDMNALVKQKGADRNSRSTVSVGAMSGALRCLRANRVDASRFFSAVFSMNPVIDGVESPMVRVLYSFLAASKKSGVSSEAVTLEQANKSITAYNHWKAGRVVSHLQWKGGTPPVAAK